MVNSQKEAKSTSKANSKSSKTAKSVSNSAIKKPYKQLDFEPIAEVYDREQFERFIPRISEVVHKHFKQLPEELLKNQNDAYQKLVKSKKNYENGYNRLKHGIIKFLIPFGFLLFVYPGILLLRKSREFNKKKEEFLKVISENENNVSKYNYAISLLLSPRLMLNEVNEEIIKYHDMGAIDYQFLNKLEESNGGPILPQSLRNDEDNNSLNTSWGVFNNNIVLNVIKKTHKIGWKLYNGSTSVSYYTTNSEGRSVLRSEVVNAYYQHPAPFYSMAARTYCYTEVAKKLNFSYNGYYTGKMFNKKPKSDKVPLENPEFDKHYDFYYNDDIGIRTIFTPWAQETFLKVNNELEPHPMFQINKSGNWLFTNLNTLDNHDTSCDDWSHVSSFSDDPYYDLNQLQTDVQKSIIEKSKERFQSIGFMTILPALKSEDQINLVNDIQRERFEELKVTNADKLETFYVLNNFYNNKALINRGIIKKLDTEIMQYIQNPKDILKMYSPDGGSLTTVALIRNHSYQATPKVMYITKYAYNARKSVQVPVKYIDYTRGESYCLFLHSKVSKDLYFHSAHENNLDIDSQNALEKGFLTNFANLFYMDTLIAKDGTLAIFAHVDKLLSNSNELDQNVTKVCEAFNTLVSFLNTEAKLTTNKAENVVKWAIGASLLAKEIEKEETCLEQAQLEVLKSGSNLEGIKLSKNSLSDKDITDNEGQLTQEQLEELESKGNEQSEVQETDSLEPSENEE